MRLDDFFVNNPGVSSRVAWSVVGLYSLVGSVIYVHMWRLARAWNQMWKWWAICVGFPVVIAALVIASGGPGSPMFYYIWNTVCVVALVAMVAAFLKVCK